MSRKRRSLIRRFLVQHRLIPRWPLRATILGAWALWGGLASAEESAAARLFHEGRTLVIAGRFAEACPKLEESQRLEPRLGTRLNVAFCHEQLGKVATAWVGFQEALLEAQRQRDVEREGFAKSRGDALAPRVPWLRVRGATRAGGSPLTIRLDGAPLPPSRWGTELPADPGEHALVAAYGGEEYWRMTVTLTESQHVDVAVPAPAPDTVAAIASDPAQSSGSSGVTADAAEAPGNRFVYELGAFIAYLYMDTDRAALDESPSSVQSVLVDDTMIRRETCATAVCDSYSLPTTAGFVVGVTGYAGYRVSSHASLGLRFLAGPRAGGGALFALGPSASLPVWERFSVGPTIFFGTASHADPGYVTMRWSTGFKDVEAQLSASLGFAIGVGTELGWTISHSSTGSVVLQATPLFLYGPNGTALSLPVGATYRWN